jgi:NAD(P)-dependent dehydrogenase (short-subunit alcohol dehydrogenase family)
MSTSRPLEGNVALVTGGGNEPGRATAILLASRGVRVIVAGREEKPLGEVVGEIVYGGGRARHIAGDVKDDGHARAVIERAFEGFGRLDIVVDDVVPPLGLSRVFDAAVPRMTGPGRLVATIRRRR